LSQSQSRASTANVDHSPVTVVMDGPTTSSQSRSSMKGHKGSRPLRERTKERKVRLKTGKAGGHRSGLRRDLNGGNRSAQDSDAAYHTYDASDSVPDRPSSGDHDSTENGRSEDAVDMLGPKSENVPQLLVNGCEKPNSELCKRTESQESDFPQHSTSDDDKHTSCAIDNDQSKRCSQSISSDNEDVTEICSHVSKISDTGPSPVKFNCDNDQMNSKTTFISVMDKKNSFEGLSVKKSVVNIKPLEHVVNDESSYMNVSVSNSSVEEPKLCAPELKIATNGCSSHVGVIIAAGSGAEIKVRATRSDLNDSDVTNLPPDPNSAVQFTPELFQLKEITPLSSRECTPTHSQSDGVLQTHQRHIRGGKPCDEMRRTTESDTDSDIEHKNKILPNIRRRKPTVSVSIQDTQSCDTGLRNRRQPGLVLHGSTANSTTGVSSSDGETEGHSSEYSRGSRRVSNHQQVLYNNG